MKKLTAMLLVLVLALVMVLPCLAVTELNSGTVNRYNVMLVIDGSGSLNSGRATDPTGLRYDALKLFMGLLTETGNNVGAIVFNEDLMLDTGLQAVNSQSEKMSLAGQIEKVGVGGDTDIGGAMLRAVQLLKGKTAENGLPSIVLLLSDGNTDLPKASSAERAQSYKDEEEAVALAKQDGITIYGIWLNTNNNGKVQEMAQMTDQTGGYYEEVKSAEDLTAAFARFYTLINNTQEIPVGPTQFDANGCVDLTFTVPSVGVEEVNVIVKTKQPLKLVRLTRPDGIELSSSEIQDITMETKRYQMLKVAKPMSGTWMLHIEGVPNSAVNISMLHNTSLGATMEIKDAREVYMANSPLVVYCDLHDAVAGAVPSEDYAKFNAELTVVNSRTQETQKVTMVPVNGRYVADYTTGNDGSYYAYVTVSCEGLSITTDRLMLGVGNLPPVVNQSTIREIVPVGLFQKGVWSAELNGLVTDPEGLPMTFSLLNNTYDQEKVALNGSELTVDCNEQETISLTVVATDTIGNTATISIDLESRDMTWIIVGIIAGILVLIAVIIIIANAVKRGRVFQCSIQVSGFDRDMSFYSTPQSQMGFQGRLSLNQFMPGDCGLDGSSCYFEATKDREICIFRSKREVYYNGIPTKQVEVMSGMSLEICASPDCSRGISIMVM